MKAFLKENMVLAAGIALPLLLTLIFFGATQLNGITSQPPRHSVVFATNYYKNMNNYPYRFVVKDDQVRFLYTPSANNNTYNNRQKPQLFIYEPAQNASREIELPAIEDLNKKIDVTIENIPEGKISSLTESPDGYAFEQNYRSDGNLMTALFGGGYSSKSRYVLRNGSHRVKVPQSVRYNSEFIGWIINERETGDGQ